MQAYALSGEYGLPVAHVVHAVVHHHLQIVHLDDLVPKHGQERECQVAVGNRLSEGAFLGSPFRVYVYPLVI